MKKQSNSTIIILVAALAAVAYFIYKKFKGSATPAKKKTASVYVGAPIIAGAMGSGGFSPIELNNTMPQPNQATLVVPHVNPFIGPGKAEYVAEQANQTYDNQPTDATEIPGTPIVSPEVLAALNNNTYLHSPMSPETLAMMGLAYKPL